MKKSLLVLMVSVIFHSMAWAADSINIGGKPSFDLTLGSGFFHQTFDQSVEYSPPAGNLAGHVQFGPFVLGVGILGMARIDQTNAGLANEITNLDQFTLISLDAGILIARRFMLIAGYGTANLKHAIDMRNNGNPQNEIRTAEANGWKLGAMIIPFHWGQVGMGLSYYVYGANTTSYTLETLTNGTQTVTNNVQGTVDSTGWMTGLTFFWTL